MAIEIRPADREELGDIVVPLLTHIGVAMSPERVARLKGTPELDVSIGAYEDGGVVGGVGSYTFSMTVPGAEGGGVPVETAGLTAVGVLPTHRRRGVLRGMMRRYLDDVHRRGQVLSALFASEGPIYGRYGYGMASIIVNAEIEQDRAAFLGHDDPPRARLISEDEAMERCPPIWEQVRKDTPGMLTRSPAWWRFRRLSDPEWSRAGRGPLQRALIEQGGRAVAYALYRHTSINDHLVLTGTLDVAEAIGASPAATRALWRYLLDIDLVGKIKAQLLPVDHPLLFLAADPRRLRMYVSDGLWVRLVDVAGALSARGYGPGGRLVLDVKDAFCPWNEGRYRLEGGVAKRTDEAADLGLDVEALGAAYMGAFPFTQLAAAGRVSELREGAIRRADGLFRAARAPWCPEMF